MITICRTAEKMLMRDGSKAWQPSPALHSRSFFPNHNSPFCLLSHPRHSFTSLSYDPWLLASLDSLALPPSPSSGRRWTAPCLSLLSPSRGTTLPVADMSQAMACLLVTQLPTPAGGAGPARPHSSPQPRLPLRRRPPRPLRPPLVHLRPLTPPLLPPPPPPRPTHLLPL